MPGRPDLLFPRRQKVLFVYRFLWHSHRGCRSARVPKSRVHFWARRHVGTSTRDRANHRDLVRTEWSALVVWECALSYPESLARKIIEFLDLRET